MPSRNLGFQIAEKLQAEIGESQEHDDGSAFGRSICGARRARGWTLEEAGRAEGIDRPTLSKIENNQAHLSFDFDIVRWLVAGTGAGHEPTATVAAVWPIKAGRATRFHYQGIL